MLRSGLASSQGIGLTVHGRRRGQDLLPIIDAAQPYGFKRLRLSSTA